VETKEPPLVPMERKISFQTGFHSRNGKLSRSSGIDSKESIPPAYVAWRAGTSNEVDVPAHEAGNRFLGSLKGLQIRALIALFSSPGYEIN
jgi:hypothetical protein